MKENTKLIRIILFNILVILTILVIYIILFPKKSYVEKELTKNTKPLEEEVLDKNINDMRIAAEEYFKTNEATGVTLKELQDANLLVDVKSAEGISCDASESYVKKIDDGLSIYIKCNDIEKKIDYSNKNEDNQDKLMCIYEYQKKLEEGYSEYGSWSEWQTEEVIPTDLVNVETKIEQIKDGTETKLVEKTITEEPIKKNSISCPQGYKEVSGTCQKKIESEQINASIKYSCPQGYIRSGTICTDKANNTKKATVEYYCPANRQDIEFILSGTKCRVFYITYEAKGNNTTYSCNSGYKLSGNKCYKTITEEQTVDKYIDITYYRYQLRTKQDKKIDIKWSTPNDQNLINQEYNMIRKVTCEF